MHKPLEIFDTIIVRAPGGAVPKIVRAFLPHEMSSWAVHGNNMKAPFADVPRNSTQWRVTHMAGRRTVTWLDCLPFETALHIAGEIDRAYEGWGQLSAHPVTFVPIGLTAEMKLKILDVIEPFGREGLLPTWSQTDTERARDAIEWAIRDGRA